MICHGGDKYSALCLYCSKGIQKKSKVRFRQHLSRGGNVAKCTKIDQHAKERSGVRCLSSASNSEHISNTCSAQSIANESSGHKIKSIPTMFGNTSAENFQLAYTRAMCINGWSFHQVNEEFMSKCFKRITSKKLPCPKKRKKIISREKERLSAWMPQASERALEEGTGASLMTDGLMDKPHKPTYPCQVLLYLPNHGMAYLGSIDAHGRKQTAE